MNASFRREAAFRATFENAAVGMAHVALDGRWLQVNARLCEIVGYSAEELLERSFQEITHPDDLEPDLTLVRQLLSGEISNYRMEKRYIRRDGRVVWVHLTVALALDEESRPELFIAVIQDITQRKSAEQALRQNQERQRKLFRFLPIAAVQAGPGGQILDANPAFCRLLGYNRKNLAGLSLLDLTHPDEREKDQKILERIRFRKRQAYQARRRYLTKAGEYVLVELSIKPVFDGNGQLEYSVATIRDLRPELRAEEAAQEARTVQLLSAGLVQGQEKERRRIAQELHDDLCQRLAVLAMRITAIAQTTEETSPTRTACDVVLKGIAEANEAVRQLSHQLHPANVERFGLEPTIRYDCKELEAGLPEGLKITFRAGDIPRELKTSVALCLYRVFQESVRNAIKYACASSIEIELAGTEEGWIRLTVSDNGEGFDLAQARAAGGIGLISMAERLRQVDGEFNLESAPGKGSTVRARAPLTAKNNLKKETAARAGL